MNNKVQLVYLVLSIVTGIAFTVLLSMMSRLMDVTSSIMNARDAIMLLLAGTFTVLSGTFFYKIVEAFYLECGRMPRVE